MVKKFQIKVRNKTLIFESVKSLEDFIFSNENILFDSFILFKDENNNIISELSVKKYIHFHKKLNVKKSIKET